MIWAAFGIKGTTPLTFCKPKMNSEAYTDILSEYLQPEAPLIAMGDAI